MTFLTASRLIIVAGKGGVGKTVVSATLGRAASRLGLRTMILEIEGKTGISSMFGQAESLAYDERVLVKGGSPDGAADLLARTLTPDKALVEYLEDHGMARVSKRLMKTGAMDIVSTAIPGIRDILVLGKVKQIERRSDLDLLILDAPAAGHAITFLQAASSLVESVQVGPIRAQAQDVLDLLTDAERCQVMLVTLPEETPVNELIDTAFALEDRVGVKLGPVVVNSVTSLPESLPSGAALAAERSGAAVSTDLVAALDAAADFRRHRFDLQQHQIERLAAALPLPQISLPYVYDGDIDLPHLDGLADAVIEQLSSLPAVS